MIKGRIRHHITKIFMMFSVIPNGDLGGGTMKFDQGFTISTGRRGDQVCTHLNLANQATAVHFFFEPVQSIVFHVASSLYLVGNDGFNALHMV